MEEGKERELARWPITHTLIISEHPHNAHFPISVIVISVTSRSGEHSYKLYFSLIIPTFQPRVRTLHRSGSLVRISRTFFEMIGERHLTNNGFKNTEK